MMSRLIVIPTSILVYQLYRSLFNSNSVAPVVISSVPAIIYPHTPLAISMIFTAFPILNIFYDFICNSKHSDMYSLQLAIEQQLLHKCFDDIQSNTNLYPIYLLLFK